MIWGPCQARYVAGQPLDLQVNYLKRNQWWFGDREAEKRREEERERERKPRSDAPGCFLIPSQFRVAPARSRMLVGHRFGLEGTTRIGISESSVANLELEISRECDAHWG